MGLWGKDQHFSGSQRGKKPEKDTEEELPEERVETNSIGETSQMGSDQKISIAPIWSGTKYLQ